MNKMIKSKKASEDYTDIFRNKDGLLYCFKDDGTVKSIIPKRFKTLDIVNELIEREVQDD